MTFEQEQNGRVIQVRTEDPLERGVDLGQQPAHPVLGAGDLAGQVIVEADEYVQLGDGLVVGRQVSAYSLECSAKYR